MLSSSIFDFLFFYFFKAQIRKNEPLLGEKIKIWSIKRTREVEHDGTTIFFFVSLNTKEGEFQHADPDHSELEITGSVLRFV